MASAGRVAGERRVLTILFFDVTGSTAMAENLDPEDVMEIMNGAFETLVVPVYEYEGTLARLMGDGMLCFFGAPIAHEDDPLRACRAALDIVERARRYRMTLEKNRGVTGFDVRVGINTGFVVVGEVGTDLRVEYTAMGDAVNLAARMESAAAPGTVLITENTHAMVKAHFTTEDLGTITVKGKTDPVQVFRLLRSGTHRDHPMHNPPRQPMIGRETERQLLETAFGELKRGQGGCLLLRGDAGLGKTRLVAEIRSHVDWPCRWIDIPSMSYEANVSYSTVRGLLYNLSDAPTDDGNRNPTEVLDRLFDSAENHDATRCPTSSEASMTLGRLRSAFRKVLEKASQTQPMVIVLDDFHWIDPSSLSLVEALLPAIHEVPLLWVFVYRPGDELPSSFTCRARQICGDRIRELEMGPLDRKSGAKLLTTLLGGTRMTPESFDLILDSADGNAFFLQEVVGGLRERGLLHPDAPGLIDISRIKKLGIPTTLHAAIMARLDRLSPADKRFLQTASVIGRRLSRRLLFEAMSGEISEDEIESAVLRLRQQGFLRQEGHRDVTSPSATTASPPRDTLVWKTTPLRVARDSEAEGPDVAADVEYYFAQAIAAEVTYNSLLRSQREELHRRVARAIESTSAEESPTLAPMLAYHYEKAGAAKEAFHYYRVAGIQAARVFAATEAVKCLSRAILVASNAHRPADVSDVPFPVDVGEVSGVHEILGDVQMTIGHYNEAITQYDEALNSEDAPGRRVKLHRKKAQVFQKWGKHREAKTWFDAAMKGLRRPLDTTEAAHIYSGLVLCACEDGDLDEALRLGRVAIEMMEAAEDRRGLAQTLNNLAIVHYRRREWDEAEEMENRCLSAWQDMKDDYGLAAAHNNLGLIARCRGTARAAIVHFQRSAALFDKLGNQHGLACVLDNMSEAHMDEGRRDDATACVRRATAILAELSVDKSEICPEMWHSGPW